ncbi:MAG: hypothetical protein HQK62_09980 [Desulfamplus sp.]|nr:hypothetical protein [Desulfamplus sp.]
MGWRAILKNKAELLLKNNPYTQYEQNTQKVESEYKKVSTKDPLADIADIAYRDPKKNEQVINSLIQVENHMDVKKIDTCLHGERCLYLNNQNQCKRVNASVFSLNECPLQKSKWFTVKHGGS